VALDTIHQSVIASATTEAGRIVETAELHASERVAREVEAIRRAEEHRYQLAVRALEDAAARKISRVKGEASKRLLARRNALLDAIFAEARKNILAMPRDAYAAEMRKRLETASGGAGGVIRIHPDEKNVMESMLALFNAQRPGDARVSLDPAAPLPKPGGFVFVAETFEVDQTLETIVDALKHELAPQLAAELFEN